MNKEREALADAVNHAANIFANKDDHELAAALLDAEQALREPVPDDERITEIIQKIDSDSGKETAIKFIRAQAARIKELNEEAWKQTDTIADLKDDLNNQIDVTDAMHSTIKELQAKIAAYEPDDAIPDSVKTEEFERAMNDLTSGLQDEKELEAREKG